MENLKQRRTACSAKELHKYRKFLERVETAKSLLFWKNIHDEIITNIGETGIIAIYNGEENNLFRCELDALPIHEINTFEHRSLTNGVS
jgi:metal-dependent amidase/aminoacylase/carboxypeptidase family protein